MYVLIIMQGCLVLILIKLNVEHFPFPDTDASVTALMGLVTIVTTEILHSASSIDFDFINGKKTETLASETFVRLLVLSSTSFSETVLA